MTAHSYFRIGCSLAVAGLSLMTTVSRAEDAAPDAAKIEFFEKKVRPILSEHCYQCHSADTKAAGGLRVDDRNGLLLGGDSGAAVVAGDVDQSLLLQRVLHENPKKKMPKEGELLTEAEVADLKQWVRDGVAWPRERIPSYVGRKREDFDELKKSHWAWQPITRPALPEVADPSWVHSDADRFILAGLEAKQLSPVADADPGTLIRRITFDLTGLPPTPADIQAFQADRSPDAFARVVDRLLTAPQFGERWGRHWLDLARYGESTGPSRNIPYPHAWKYRDYVIDAVNRDVPFDRFVQEQIAGDLLPASTPEERNRLLTATGFLALGVKDVNQRFKTRFIMDNADEQIDAVTRSILGLTVTCARCHDHKFDPIPTTDYYALAGIFTSTDNAAGLRNKMGGGGLDYYDPAMLVRLAGEVAPPPPDEVAKLEAEVAAAKKAWEEIRDTPEGLKPGAGGAPTQRAYRTKFEGLQASLRTLTDPAARGLVTHGVREGKKPTDTEVRIRGETERIGPTVPRGFLTTFTVPDAPGINPAQSGRLELAQWLTSANNPLTARVIVNRVWQHLFGVGLVSSVDNFGVKGDVPSNPALLDYLAQEFIRDGWSIKTLVRKLALTHAYQLGIDAPTPNRAADPENRLVWRHSPRRLSAEEVRDAMLASAGRRLKLTPPGPSATKDLKMVEMRDNGPEARKITEAADNSTSRSIYLPLLRGVTPQTLEAFDPVSQTLVSGTRDATTVPTQALYLLNSTFVRQQSLAFAERVVSDTQRVDAEWIREMYLDVLGRLPNANEAARADRFLAEYASSYRAGAPIAQAVAQAPTAATESETGKATAVAGQAANPDDVNRTPEVPKEIPLQPKDAKTAAWMSFIQALYASAEFRFVR